MAISLTLVIAGNPRVGDVGRVIDLDVGEDVSDRETFEIVFRKPSGAVLTETASLVGTQVLQVTTPSGFLDESGVWEAQARLVDTTPTPDKVELSPVGSFFVGPAL